MAETTEKAKTPEDKRHTMPSHILLGLSVLGCWSAPFVIFYSALNLNEQVTIFTRWLFIQIPSMIFAVCMIIGESRRVRPIKLRSVRTIVCSLLMCASIGGFAATIHFYSRIYPLAYEAAVRTKMHGSLDMETLQKDSMLTIQEYSDNIISQRRVSLPSYWSTPLSGNGGNEPVPKHLLTEYTLLRPNYVSIESDLGNEPCLFFDYGGGMADPYGIVVGSPTFKFDPDWPMKWKWEDGIYYFQEDHYYRNNTYEVR